MAYIAENEDLRMLRTEQVLDLFPVSKSTLHRLIKNGDFPEPMKMSGVRMWRYSHLRQWIESHQSPSPPSRSKRGADLI